MSYTNSSLVDCTVKSPNHSGTRTHTIDRITPHCVVGQLSAESIGGCFTDTSRQASCNYGIGKDGRVCLVVDESNRSWCSSSNANDQRAITIECASDTASPYAMNTAVYNKLVKLCIDICKRNNLTKVLWMSDKTTSLAYTPKTGECVLTVHRWFANKSCPGDWLYSRMSQLASDINAGLGSTTSTSSSSSTKAAANTTADPKTIWNYLLSKIGNAFGVAGLMGNLYAESGLVPNNLQNTYNTKLGMTDAAYTAAVDDGSYTKFSSDSAGYGLAQWTYSTRKAALKTYADAQNASIGNLNMQLGFLYKELSESYSSVLTTLKNAKTVLEASNAVLTKFEKPADQGSSVQAKRAEYGQKYYDTYAGGSSSSTSSVSSSSTSSVSSSFGGSSSSSKTATDSAQSKDSSLAGTYTTTAQLNIRNGAGTGKSIIVTIPKGTSVKNYGYYTAVNGVKWLYIQFTYNSVTYTGFACATYLKKS